MENRDRRHQEKERDDLVNVNVSFQTQLPESMARPTREAENPAGYATGVFYVATHEFRQASIQNLLTYGITRQ